MLRRHSVGKCRTINNTVLHQWLLINVFLLTETILQFIITAFLFCDEYKHISNEYLGKKLLDIAYATFRTEQFQRIKLKLPPYSEKYTYPDTHTEFHFLSIRYLNK